MWVLWNHPMQMNEGEERASDARLGTSGCPGSSSFGPGSYAAMSATLSNQIVTTQVAPPWGCR